MKLINIAKLGGLMLFLTMVMTSCGDDITVNTLQNSDDKLCGKTWEAEYVTDAGTHTIYRLRFTKDSYQGEETTIAYTSDGTNTNIREFTWKWKDDSMEGLDLKFFNETKSFDNVWIRDNYLSGMLDGEYITLTLQ